MIAGKVSQVLRSERALSSVEALALVEVETPAGPVAAADALRAQPGERVLLSQGCAARAAFGSNCPADAVVLCVLD